MACVPLLKDAVAASLAYGSDGTSNSATLGVLSEGFSINAKFDGMGDQRVSVDPMAASQLIKEGYVVLVEIGAGSFAGFTNEAYSAAGCRVVPRDEVIRASDVLFAIEPPTRDFTKMTGKVLIAWVGRLSEKGKDMVERANKQNITLIDVTAAPRITIAQKLDVLSSQAKVAGHRAVIEASHVFGRFHTGEMTAAGKFPPSKTFVLGCGVAGLAAIGTSRALGSVVSAWDVRDVSDQCHSMGARWVKVDFREDGAGDGGYAKESSPEFKRAQQNTFLKVLGDTDIVITTAAIPGHASPLLITKDAVAAMKAGSVVIDLAAVGGGNCELTKKDEMYTTSNGVTIIGYTDMPARMANQSSAMYAQNMLNLIKHIQGAKKATSLLDNIEKQQSPEGDIVARSIVCCMHGQKLEMPPPPQPTPVRAKPLVRASASVKEPVSPFHQAVISMFSLTAFVLFVLGLGEGVGTSLVSVFLLAGAAGYQAVWGVANALHTPLMSVTNAISGMTAVGGLLLLDSCKSDGDDLAIVLAMIAIAFSAVNIVGGFLVSQRMLNLFRGAHTDYSYLLLIPGFLLTLVAAVRPELRTLGGFLSGFLCIGAIGALASMSSANAGCKLGVIGVFSSLTITLVSLVHADTIRMGLYVLAAGAFGGVLVGIIVSPIKLPQTVAAFHSLVGLAAMLTSIGSFAHSKHLGFSAENVSLLICTFVGGITLTGSIIAFGKLNGNLTTTPLNLPFKNFLNFLGLTAFITLGTLFLQAKSFVVGLQILWGVSAIALIMGWHLVGSVGGGDMPVCITVLNSYSGWALVAEGFLLKSSVLTIVGSLIGFSGAILTKIMCDAMNRDILNVIFGGINSSPVSRGDDSGPKEHAETTVSTVAELLVHSKEVLVVPGYGMAMARAQIAMGELAGLLRDHGVAFKFGVHPVAGRMPGQMNVLLAEAGVPHDCVLEMDEVNPSMETNDVVLVVGANDVVNSAAQEIEGCAIWGMPVIEVWRAKKVIFCKRSMAGGYADLDNPVFYKENTDMLLGDAKKTADSLTAKVRQLLEVV